MCLFVVWVYEANYYFVLVVLVSRGKPKFTESLNLRVRRETLEALVDRVDLLGKGCVSDYVRELLDEALFGGVR